MTVCEIQIPPPADPTREGMMEWRMVVLSEDGWIKRKHGTGMMWMIVMMMMCVKPSLCQLGQRWHETRLMLTNHLYQEEKG